MRKQPDSCAISPSRNWAGERQKHRDRPRPLQVPFERRAVNLDVLHGDRFRAGDWGWNFGLYLRRNLWDYRCHDRQREDINQSNRSHRFVFLAIHGRSVVMGDKTSQHYPIFAAANYRVCQPRNCWTERLAKGF
jgi:hypothetical protein